jgi:penicillin amidase
MSWEKRVYAVLATHIMKQLIAKQIVNEKSLWWDNIETKKQKGVENRDSFETF